MKKFIFGLLIVFCSGCMEIEKQPFQVGDIVVHIATGKKGSVYSCTGSNWVTVNMESEAYGITPVYFKAAELELAKDGQ